MLNDHDDGGALQTEGQERLEAVVEVFEAAWLKGERPRIEAHIQHEDDTHRRCILVELVHAEMEFRLKAGEPARIEEYLVRFPELVSRDAVILTLVEREYRLRGRTDAISPQELAERFPHLAEDMAKRLGNNAASTIHAVAVDPSQRADLDSRGPSQAIDTTTRFPGFEIGSELGRGGMGVVYRAHDVTLNRDIAIKFLHDKYAPNSFAARRFLEEARITAQLQHPGIPPVHQVGTTPNGRPFIAMKLIKGRTLADILTGYHPQAAHGELVAAFEQVCHAVAYAHNHGVIHRDIKPQNVMVGAFGEVQVMDWGLAKFRTETRAETAETTAASTFYDPRDDTDADSKTRAGSFLGTPAYMAPEQALGAVDRIDQRSDVFGLGGVLCAILTGMPPFVGDDPESTRLDSAQGKLDAAFARLDACGAEPELVALCKQCLAADSAYRPQYAGEVAKAVTGLRVMAAERARNAELDRVKAEGELQAAEVRTAEQRKRRKVQAVLGLAFTALVVLGGVFAWWKDRQEADRIAERVRADADKAADRAAAEARGRQAVESGITLAANLRDKFRFADAQAALDQAAAIIPDEASREIRARLDLARENLAFVRELDEIRVSRVRSGHWKPLAEVAAAYREVFWSRGFDLENSDPALIANRVSASPISRYLVVALDDWAGVVAADRATRDRLLMITRQVDPGPWSDRLRDPMTWQDPALLEQLSAEIDLNAIPANQLVLLVQLRREPWAGADQLLAEAALRYPGEFWVQYEAGYYYTLKDPRPAAGMSYLRAALALRPDNTGALSLLGVCCARSGDLKGAIAAYREAIRLDSNDFAAYANLGLALFDQGDVDGAIVCLREAIRLDPKNASAQLALGNALNARQDVHGAIEAYREAIEAYRGAIRLNPKDIVAHFNLGVALFSNKEVDGAIVSFREAIRLDPKNANAHVAMGNALNAKQNVHGAIEAYREAIRLNPTDVATQINLGVALFNTKDVDGAIVSLREAIRLDPKNAGAYTRLGIALNAKQNVHGAIEAYREAIRLNPNDAVAHFNLGVALFSNKEVDWAIVSLREAIRLDPTNASGHNQLGLLLADRGKYAEAEVELRKALAIQEKLAAEFPTMLIYRIECGGIYYNLACLAAIVSTKDADKKRVHADRAMELLQQSVKAGYTTAAQMAKDSDLDPLRSRADFQALLSSLQTNPKEPPREPAPPPRPVR